MKTPKPVLPEPSPPQQSTAPDAAGDPVADVPLPPGTPTDRFAIQPGEIEFITVGSIEVVTHPVATDAPRTDWICGRSASGTYTVAFRPAETIGVPPTPTTPAICSTLPVTDFMAYRHSRGVECFVWHQLELCRESQSHAGRPGQLTR